MFLQPMIHCINEQLNGRYRQGSLEIYFQIWVTMATVTEDIVDSVDSVDQQIQSMTQDDGSFDNESINSTDM